MDLLTEKEGDPYNELMKTLERNVAILKIESHYNLKIVHEFDIKLTWFHNVSRGFVDKLDSLWRIAETHQPTENEIKQFADQISNAWTSANRQIYEKCSKIRVASRTLHGIPLSLLLDKIKKDIILLKVSLQLYKSTYDQECVLKGYKLIKESESLIRSLEKCDSKVQQYLWISSLIPQLTKLESMIDRYVNNVELLPMKKSFSFDLSVFSFVTKLLTGELLGHETIDPNYVLMENKPKKPVFIVKKVKRKTSCPSPT